MGGVGLIGGIRSHDGWSGSVSSYGGEGGTRLNNAVIDTPPSVDRSKKEKALLRYSGGNVSGLEDVLKIEEDLVEESVNREKKNLEMETELEMMRLRKEKVLLLYHIAVLLYCCRGCVLLLYYVYIA